MSPTYRPVPDEVKVALLRLTARLADERAAAQAHAAAVARKAKERALRESKRAAARKEVAVLEEQLRAARAKLREAAIDPETPGAGRTRGAAVAAVAYEQACAPLRALGVTSLDVRRWAGQAGVDCPGSGRLPVRVIDAFLADRQAVPA